MVLLLILHPAGLCCWHAAVHMRALWLARSRRPGMGAWLGLFLRSAAVAALVPGSLELLFAARWRHRAVLLLHAPSC